MKYVKWGAIAIGVVLLLAFWESMSDSGQQWLSAALVFGWGVWLILKALDTNHAHTNQRLDHIQYLIQQLNDQRSKND